MDIKRYNKQVFSGGYKIETLGKKELKIKYNNKFI